MAVDMLGDNVKIQKICNLHQIINKYMNKVPIFPIFCAKFLFFSLFSGIANSYFPMFFYLSYYLTPWHFPPDFGFGNHKN